MTFAFRSDPQVSLGEHPKSGLVLARGMAYGVIPFVLLGDPDVRLPR